jgi:uncharacterized protein DUF6526
MEDGMVEQNLANHGKLVPAFHFFAVPVMAANMIWAIVRLWTMGISFASVFSVIVTAALLVVTFEARLFALAVQDRVIRLEERLRYEKVLPEELRWRADELSVNQFVALRFASDDELAALMRKVLEEKVDQRKAIKQQIKSWRPDYLRA